MSEPEPTPRILSTSESTLRINPRFSLGSSPDPGSYITPAGSSPDSDSRSIRGPEDRLNSSIYTKFILNGNSVFRDNYNLKSATRVNLPSESTPRASYPTEPAPRASYPTEPAPRTSFSTEPEPRASFSTDPAPRPSFSTEPSPRASFPSDPATKASFPSEPAPRASFPSEPAPRASFPSETAARSTSFPIEPETTGSFLVSKTHLLLPVPKLNQGRLGPD